MPKFRVTLYPKEWRIVEATDATEALNKALSGVDVEGSGIDSLVSPEVEQLTD